MLQRHDLNCRVGTAADFIENDYDRYVPLPDDYEIDEGCQNTRSNQDKTINTNGRQLLDVCKMTNLRILNGRVGDDAGIGATTCHKYNGCSTVDLVLCSPPLIPTINHFSVLPQHPFSDHSAIRFSIVVAQKPCENAFKKTIDKMIWNHQDKDIFVESMQSQDVLSIFSEMIEITERNSVDEVSVNTAVILCTDAIRKAADPLFLRKKYVNSRDISSNGPVWADGNYKTTKKYFYRCNDRYKKHPSDENRKSMFQARSAFKSASSACRRNYERTQSSKLLNARVNNLKQYWKMLSGQSKRQKPLVTKDIFFNYFMSLSNPNDPFYSPEPEILHDYATMIENDIQCTFEELNDVIEETEVLNAIKQLKHGKSSGEDLLINEFFFYGRDHLSYYLTVLFNYVFQSGFFPHGWSDGLLVPLHKKGSFSDPQNFREITLLSVLGKLFTRVINNRLKDWAEKYSIYIEAQYGFRKGRNTTDCIFVLNSIINEFAAKKKTLYAFFVDYSKAFDYIVRENLWYKLLVCGIRGRIFNIISSMYRCVKTKVFVNGECSESFDCKLGVRQGECLSPFLFAMYVNDMEQNLTESGIGIPVGDMKISMLFYADDLVIFSDSPNGLQNGITALHGYCTKWKLKLNTEKSKVMVFKKGRPNVSTEWYFGPHKLSVANKITYLGIVFTSNGSVNRAQTTLAEQASKAVFSLYKKINTYSNLTPDFMMDLFDKFIVPDLTYACEMWGFHPSIQIERIHTKYCKNCLGVKKSAQNDFVYGELGRLPLINIRYVRIMKYWLNIVHGNKSLYVSALYHSSLANINVNTPHCWARSVRDLLLSIGLGEAWYNQGVGDCNTFINIFRMRIMDIAKQDWSSRLNNSSRARFYRAVKPDFGQGKYLEIVNVPSHRKALTKLLTSSHRLRCETGRWERPVVPYENRMCLVCLDKIGDEFHFLLECPRHQSLRSRLIGRYYWNRPSMLKLQQLLNSTCTNVIRVVAKFVYKAFNDL